jgi:hypothetical protein
MSNMLTYFGYGANQSPEMMEAMVGRVPEGEPARLHDHELAIQQPHEISEVVRGILAAYRTEQEVAEFETYVIRRRQGGVVIAMAWQLTPLERELVDNWEMNDGLWYQKTDVSVETARGLVAATTEIMDDPTFTAAVDLRPDLPVFLNNKDRLLEVAEIVREEYLAQKR